MLAGLSPISQPKKRLKIVATLKVFGKRAITPPPVKPPPPPKVSKPKPPPKVATKVPTASKAIRRSGRSSRMSEEVFLPPSGDDFTGGGHHYESTNDADDVEVETGGEFSYQHVHVLDPPFGSGLKVIALEPVSIPFSSLDFGFLTRASSYQSSISSLPSKVFIKSTKVNLQHLCHSAYKGVSDAYKETYDDLQALRAQVASKKARPVKLLIESQKLKAEFDDASSKVAAKGLKLRADYYSILACNDELVIAQAS
ncbi:conserved hypothetical protein [Ricinus communis]|uniref:Uncharacterized protein n=1 Tax=Ricinus communis TaxID=3988 RepID=B9T1H0_RICCO|nr:conserved hypothetical protein [Ricinus communis]